MIINNNDFYEFTNYFPKQQQNMKKQPEIIITKRSGERVPYEYEKISDRIRLLTDGITGVSASMIEMHMNMHVQANINTTTIDEILLRTIVDLIDEEILPIEGNVNYELVAGRQLCGMLRKEVYGQYTPHRLFDIVKKNVDVGLYTTDLLSWYTEQEWDAMEKFIDHSKDDSMVYSALEQLKDKYLVKNRSTNQLYETPQIRYIVAAATIYHMEDVSERLELIQEYYDQASNGEYTLSTPVLAGLGTPTKQFSSCVLIKVGDDTKAIQAAANLVEDYASKRAGLGIDISRIRAIGGPVRNGEIQHTGVVPFLKKLFYGMRAFSQGGIRNSSATVTYPIWHYQFDDIIQLKNNRGIEETRVRHLDYSVALSSLFLMRFKNQQNITFFDPNEVPDLYELYYRDIAEFNKKYVYYEQNAAKLGIRSKSVSADQVIRQWLIKERTETGRIYLLFIDNVQRQSVFDTRLFPIYQSNLCQEILLPTLEFTNKHPSSNTFVKLTQGDQFIIRDIESEVSTVNRGIVKVSKLLKTDEINFEYCNTIYNV